MKRIIFVIIVLSLIFLVGCEQQQTATTTPINGASMNVGVVIGNDVTQGISALELAKHDKEGDCWIVYEGQVYDYSDTQFHPDMAETFFEHCGKTTGFEEGATARHRQSSPERVANYGDYIGDLK